MTLSRIAKLAAAFAAGVAATALIMTATAQVTLKTETGDIQVDSVAKLDNPWGMTFLPDGRLLISEKPGNLRLFNTADGALSEPLSGLPKVAYQGQGGLLDVEIDPNFAENQLVYFYYSEAADPQPDKSYDDGDTRTGTKPGEDNVVKGGAVARGRLDGTALKDVAVIWRQEPKQLGRGHFGGRLALRPDGKLFITSGDRQRFDPAQDVNGNLGKVLRINADGTMPDDNPFKDKGRADIYSMGHRNPLGIAFEPGGELWIDEMGPKGGDELNLIKPGNNYGWPVVSNGDNYDDTPIPDHPTRPEFTQPVKFWNPVISPSGMMFYTGDLFPGWKGSVVMGGLSSMALIRVTLDGDKATGEERIAMGQRIRDLVQAPDGSVYVLTDGDGAELWHLTPAKAT